MLVQFLKALQVVDLSLCTMGETERHQRAETQKLCDNKSPARFTKSDPPGISKNLEGPASHDSVCELLKEVRVFSDSEQQPSGNQQKHPNANATVLQEDQYTGIYIEGSPKSDKILLTWQLM